MGIPATTERPLTINGAKGGDSQAQTPIESPDDLRSIAKAKILLAIGEGEFDGQLSGQNVFLDGTPLLDSNGAENFPGVIWDFRPGSVQQSYIPGLPSLENETSVGIELKSTQPYTRAISNSLLSAVRIRLRWPALQQQLDNGDVTGYRIAYAIDLSTDGREYETLLNTSVNGKTTQAYERSHRVDLPVGNNWQIRIRRLTANQNNNRVADTMQIAAITDVIDRKFKYPNTALLYVEFDASQFQNIPVISCEPFMRKIKVPTNYDPLTRVYSGVWDGSFKVAWSDNPAWVSYDIILDDRFGTGRRISAALVDKWELYNIAQYCDQLVPDGKGGTEPRYICNIYIQQATEAWQVLRDLASIYRGMTYWSNGQMYSVADMPRDVDFTYNNSNVIDGKFSYSSSSEKVKYTRALISWDNPDNAFESDVTSVSDQSLQRRYGDNVIELSALGCTRESEAQRRGKWAIYSNNNDRAVSFKVGLDGSIPIPGFVIGVADQLIAGSRIGGRISAVNGKKITLDQVGNIAVNDRLIINLPSGIAQARSIQAINGREITVTTAYSETPRTQLLWSIESDELKLQQFRVLRVGKAESDSIEYEITAVEHNPSKFAYIDTGARLEERPISKLPIGAQDAPASVTISQSIFTEQTISVTTMNIQWESAKNAISYEVEWRKDDGEWFTLPKVNNTSVDIRGVYTGKYLARVRAINSANVKSIARESALTSITGKDSNQHVVANLSTAPGPFGIIVNWEFPLGSDDTLFTEIQTATDITGSNAKKLADIAYPNNSYQVTNLPRRTVLFFRALLVDKAGNKGEWTSWVRGEVSDVQSDYDALFGETFKVFTWFAWADDNQGNGFTIEEAEGEGKSYLGVATEMKTATASDNWQDYTWSKIQTVIPELFSPEEAAKLDNLMAGKVPAGDKDMLAAQDALNNPALANDLLTSLALLSNGIDAASLNGETPGGAQSKANAAQSAAQAYSLAKANLAETTAKAYADGVVSDEETRAIADAQAKADAAKAAAIAAAATDASTKANNAKAAAQTYALAKANLAETTSKAYADGVVSDEETRAIADAQAKADAAKTAAIAAAATDASTKANDAKAAAQTYALAKANLAEITAKAYADGVVSDEETRAIADAQAKADAAEVNAISAAALDASTKANAAQSAAQAYALAKANLAEVTAKAHADGKVTAEETRAIADAQTKANNAKDQAIAAAAIDATSKANNAISIAAADATTKSNTAKAQAEANSALDALNKANAAVENANANTSLVASKILSAGQQLTINGSGVLGDNTNFSGFTYDGSQSPNGFSGSFYLQSGTTTRFSDEYMQVEPSQKHIQKVWVKGGSEVSRYYIGIACFDIDKNIIEPKYTMHNKQSLSELAVDLKPGDTTITFVDDIDVDSFTAWGYAAHRRKLVFWNYTNSYGYTYPPETYSRSVSTHDLWTGPESLIGKVMTLSAPWTGSLFPAGTKLSQTSDGASYKYITAGNKATTEEWTENVGTFGGIDFSGSNISSLLHPGTVYIKHLFLLNRNASSQAEIWLSGLSLTAEYETLLGAQEKAYAAQIAAESYALAKANLAETTAKAYADGVVSDEEARAIADAQAKADAAKSAAISAAAADATTKANAAQSAAQAYALAKANLAEVTAKAHADGKVTAEETRAIADAQAKADAAKTAAITAAAADATAKANNAKSQAISTAASDATTKANNANAQATASASLDALNKANTAKADAISIAAADATNKAESAKSAAINSASLDATTKANNAKTTAEAYALAKANLAETTAKAYADGVVSDEEARAIADAQAKANTAQTAAIAAAAADATTKANNAKSQAISAAASDATAKSNDAKAQATATAALDALNKANSAESAAISAAAIDATTKANNAKSTAEANAIAQATIKANAAEAAAIAASAPASLDQKVVTLGGFKTYYYIVIPLCRVLQLSDGTGNSHMYTTGRIIFKRTSGNGQMVELTVNAQSGYSQAWNIFDYTESSNVDGIDPVTFYKGGIEYYGVAVKIAAQFQRNYFIGNHFSSDVDNNVLKPFEYFRVDTNEVLDEEINTTISTYISPRATKSNSPYLVNGQKLETEIGAQGRATAAETGAVNSVSLGNFTASVGLMSTLIANSALFNELKSKLGSFGGLTADTIAALAIATNHLQAGAITTDKVAANAITAQQIAALAIATNHLQASAITTDKVAANAITAQQIASLAIATNHLQAGLITADKVAASAIATNNLQAGAITSDKLTVNTALIQKLISDQGLFNQLQAQLGIFGGLAANSIAAKAITTDKLDVRARNLLNNFSATASSVGWSNFPLVSHNHNGQTVIAMQVKGSGDLIGVSDLFDIDNTKIYELNFTIHRQSGGSTGSRYLGLSPDNGTVIDYNASTRAVNNQSSTNFYFWSGNIADGEYRQMRAYIVGSEVDINSVPESLNVNSICKLKPGCKKILIRALNYYNAGTVSEDRWINPSITEIGGGQISANQIVANSGLFNILKSKIAQFGGLTANELQVDNALINKLVSTSALFNELTARLAAFGGLTANSIASNAINGNHISAGSKIESPIIEGGEFRLIGANTMKIESETSFGPDSLIEWRGPKLLLNGVPDWANIRKSNASRWTDANGDEYFGGSLSAGILRTGVTNPDKNAYAANSYPVVIGPFGSGGKAKTIVVSFDYDASWTATSSANGAAPVLSWQLQRKIGSGSWTTVSSGTFTGSINSTYESEISRYLVSEFCNGSSTFTDTSTSTSDFSYQLKVISQTRYSATSNVNNQKITVISTEQ
ncbi:host specificity protein J [Shewanella sp. SG41-4]|uniref:host specificity protein J n=1 Tax=Shewanella sp. SG41-4 TaxID=2760976 RepID=UPI001601F401|nr:host specificity protein J [Shewanella sp. SG41-4]MBB1439890.1 host specificity protein J [Shewanella sp. SG41-4]